MESSDSSPDPLGCRPLHLWDGAVARSHGMATGASREHSTRGGRACGLSPRETRRRAPLHLPRCAPEAQHSEKMRRRLRLRLVQGLRAPGHLEQSIELRGGMCPAAPGPAGGQPSLTPLWPPGGRAAPSPREAQEASLGAPARGGGCPRAAPGCGCGPPLCERRASRSWAAPSWRTRAPEVGGAELSVVGTTYLTIGSIF